ncbi:MAG: TRAP transporter large permease subunit [Hydrogenophaga sp.]|uniref:TRAP transporter large permease n=1 Tax=Hydrogenophaga sp. TaxID=1904254 RepID=UPI002724CE09|nr:TRAP transporter large permease subunit [Hydrogenophaga sp.]MDO9479827.1 TRAP transporter large permease subunit [Hydrogenophaga sp.]MDP2093585.1 TRAP transporter large permease subunit [Hydrogenophaga sp.]MDP3345308.1 TRAP transporter large permease subunit [Hydrogenophaga sp.]MDP3806109.1 TRAP transporter large permease subunit [Hydrogenophaga sp.]MDP3926111.1 TRAP transporter large permease subunit [Hydrogenophaga sp.]
MSQSLILWAVGAWFAIFLLLGQNVSTVLLGSGVVGVSLWMGPRVFDGIIGPDIFYTASIYSLSIIPLYLVMAQLLLRGGVIVDLFRVAHRLSGYKRFPLGVATILTGGLLGAVCGSGSASAAALATLAGPELERVGYTRRFAVGLAAVSGSLSAVIPPSLIVIIYGSITMVPIGHLFIGLVGPGLLCMVVYVVCIRCFAEVKPGAVDGVKLDAHEDPRLFRRSLHAFAFVLLLMAVVFGGIYGGIITVAEAGAIGAFTALVGMVAMRRVTLKDIAISMSDSAKVTGMLMMLVIGAQIMARFLAFSRVPRELVALLEPILDQPYLLLALLMGLFFLAGMILESAAVIVLLVPMLLPLLQAAQIDLLWFGVMASFMIALGLLTPPVGLSVYAAASAARFPVAEVFRPATLFAVAAGVIVTTAMLVFPGLVTWLPSHIP